MTTLELALKACPKHMTYGPCGGVGPAGACEVEGIGCPFIGTEIPTWTGIQPSSGGVTPAGRAFLEVLERRPVIVTDFSTAPMDARSLEAAARPLVNACDAVLMGDHGGARVQFPPSYRALLAIKAGLKPWLGLNCRDRNRVALEGELAALEHLNVTGIHAITGDHTQSGHRPDAQPVFDLDSTRLASLARSKGLLVSVGESPLTAPVLERPFRLAQKVRAGAQICFVNHAGAGKATLEFISDARAQGASVPCIAGVAVVTSAASARLIRHFHNLVLPPRYLERILEADHPRRAGIAAAIWLGEQLLNVPGVRGLNLSAVPEAGRELELAQDLAEVGRAFL